MNKLMAANWKMYKTWDEATVTAADLAGRFRDGLPKGREALVFPPFTAIRAVVGALSGHAGFAVGAQDFYPAAEGAFTGEISPAMILDSGATWALVGHSERRHVIGETDELIGSKVRFGLSAGLGVVLCVGETLDERKADRVEAVLSAQLAAGLADLPAGAAPERLAIAYEPVWAIGTGLTAGPSEIAAAHLFVREVLLGKLGPAGQLTRILYGGSVKPENTAEILGIDNVDGVLVGGASLRAGSFADIVQAGA